MVNPNPEAYLDDKVKIVEGTGEESHDPNGRWFPTKNDMADSYVLGGDWRRRSILSLNEDDPDKDEGLWSRGMTSILNRRMKATFLILLEIWTPPWLMHLYLAVKLNLFFGNGDLDSGTINLHPQYLIRRSKTCISISAVAITSSFLHPSRVTSTVMAIRGRWKLKERFSFYRF